MDCARRAERVATIQLPREYINMAIQMYPRVLSIGSAPAAICTQCESCCCEHQTFRMDVYGRGGSPCGPNHPECNRPPTPEPAGPPALQTKSPLTVERKCSSLVKKYARKRLLSKERRAGKFNCKFCRSNGETRRIFTSHDLKNEQGIITCPILRNFVCPKCQATGDNAHTHKYCPVEPYQLKHAYVTAHNAFGKNLVLKY